MKRERDTINKETQQNKKRRYTLLNKREKNEKEEKKDLLRNLDVQHTHSTAQGNTTQHNETQEIGQSITQVW